MREAVMEGLKFKAVIEGLGVVGAIGILGYLLVTGAVVDDSIKIGLIALVLLLGAYFGFSAFEHVKRGNDS
jgi:hypothetical protein